MHVVVYLPDGFYAGIASTIAETFQTANDVSESEILSLEFVSNQTKAKSNSGITFPSKKRPSKPMDVLILLAGLRPEPEQALRLLEKESKCVRPLIQLAQKQDAVIATTCGAAYLLAASGLLDGKRATISWWLKREAKRRFPQVRWEPQRLIVRQGRIYTTGAAYAGLELITRLLIDLGFKKEERQVRKLMVLPPSREFQSPYEIQPAVAYESFESRLVSKIKGSLRQLTPLSLAERLGVSPRTLSRKFFDELQTSPGRWIREKRLEAARKLLETTPLNVSEICFAVGYQDVPSFSRLFSESTGMSPGEFRKQLQP
jgi:transcriptional regulator GlxA family with amidase domain